MNDIAEKTRDEATNIVALVDANPVMVLTDREKFNQFYEQMKAEADKLVPDTSTEKGRKEIASMAYKVARTKTAIDEAGKKLNEGARARINAVDESRREIRLQLDALRDSVRLPLTEWETAEEEREEKCKATIASLRNVVVLPFGASAADARERLDEINTIVLDFDELKGYGPQATLLRDQAIATLQFQVDQLAREELDRAELEKLRAETAERERLDEEARIASEKKAQAEAAAKAETERQAKAEAEQQARIDAAAKAAEETARAEAERVHAEALAAEKRRADEAEAAAKDEADRIAKAEQERKAEAERVAAETARREADQAHRSSILRAAKEAIMEAGSIEEAVAKSIVLAIAAGNVPAVSIKF